MNYIPSIYNTNDLGYKLTTGKLREKRKHSEQLNKYLAGLIDTDGCVRLEVRRMKGFLRVYINVELSQSATSDPDFEMVRSLKDFYNLGSLKYRIPDQGDNVASRCQWTLGDKESKMLFNRIGKHLRLRATHWQNMIWVSAQHRGIKDISDSAIEELKEYARCSSKNSTYLKMPKHLSWSYVAGVIAGDGSLNISHKGENRYGTLTMKVTQEDDRLLKLFKRDFKGSIYYSDTWCDWQRSLGIRDASFAVRFLKKIRQYICHPKKYQIVNEMLRIHEAHRQQRLSKRDSKE